MRSPGSLLQVLMRPSKTALNRLLYFNFNDYFHEHGCLLLYQHGLLRKNFMISFSYYLGIIAECFSGIGQCIIVRITSPCYNTEAYSEPCQMSKMDLFAKILNIFESLFGFEKSVI